MPNPDVWLSLFQGPYIPHGHCFRWQPSLVALHVVSDFLVAFAYFSIPTMRVYFVRKRQDTPFTTVFLLFGTFIACRGAGHLLDIWTLWFPHYWLAGTERALTAFISCLTALKLVEWMPQFLALRSPSELEALNQQLQQEIAARTLAQQTLQRLVEGTASATGAAFFASLVENLAQALQVKHAFVSESQADPATAQIPIIFLSALSNALDKVKAFEVGGGDYITKPFQMAEVLVRVRNQLLAQQTWGRCRPSFMSRLPRYRPRINGFSKLPTKTV